LDFWNVKSAVHWYLKNHTVLKTFIFKQRSKGTFAVISLMVGSTLTDLESKYVPPVGFNASADTIKSDSVKNYLSLDRNQARVMIFMANTFWVKKICTEKFFM
jgi:hypothetical protein